MAITGSEYGGVPVGAHVITKTAGSMSAKIGIGIASIGAIAFGGALVGLLAGATAFGVAFGLGAVITICIGIYQLQRAKDEERLWHPIELHFPTWGLPLGSNPQVAVTRASKKPIPDNPHVEIVAAVRCTERVKYDVGSDTKTETEQVVLDRPRLVGAIANNTFQGTLDLSIPVDRGAPTLSLHHNEIFWELSLQLGQLTTIQREMTFDLLVVAAIDRAEQRFVDAPPPPNGLAPYDA